MMKKLTRLLVISMILVLSAPTANAQMGVEGAQTSVENIQRTLDLQGNARNNRYQKIQGNPYLNEEFIMGRVKLKDGFLYQGLLRFDKYTGSMQFKKEDKVFVLSTPEKVDFVEIGDYLFIYSKYKLSISEEETESGGFFIVDVNKECKLLEKHSVIYQGKEPTNGIVPEKPASFIGQEVVFFIHVGDQAAIKIKNKKSLIAILSDKKTEIAKYIKSERKHTRNREDLIDIVEYYNTLI